MDLWEKSLSLIREKVNRHNFDTWIKPLRLASITDDSVSIEVPNKFFQDWLNDNYLGLISDILKEVGNRDFSVTFKVKKESGRYVRGGVKQTEEVVEKRDTQVEQKEPNPFSSRYTFQNFVTGSSNQFAVAASIAVSNNPGKTYNPLFIYGGVGLGKTHLLCAIGHQVIANNRKAKVIYVSSEKFTNEVITAIRCNKMSDFKMRYRGIDLLLIDDIQFIAGKEATQEEFFHTFNSLFESHKQIVMTSDSFPKDIQKLDERLRSRFEWGLIADIQPPELELRVAILKSKAELNSYQLPDDVAFFIANHYKSNIRELEGALTRVVAFSSLTGQDISVGMAMDVLKIKEESMVLTIDDIQKAVAGYYNIKVPDLKSQRKLKAIAVPRQVAMYLCRTLTEASYPEIGKGFGNKDHSTVIYAFKKVERDIGSDHSMRNAVDTLSKRLRS
jgi:chromosomal replication initiator protein